VLNDLLLHRNRYGFSMGIFHLTSSIAPKENGARNPGAIFKYLNAVSD
jgi:hypothetical protein